jgi:biotin carboxyl carrier protein
MSTTEVTSEVIGSVWKIEKAVGDMLEEGDLIMILESMKMEIAVEAPVAGKLVEIKVGLEESVDEDQVLCLIES